MEHKFYQLRYLPIFEQGLKAVSLLGLAAFSCLKGIMKL